MDNVNWRKWWKEQNISLPDKNPIVNWEGVDGAGKTTLQNIVMDIIGHTFLVHTSAPKKEMTPLYYSNLLSGILDCFKNIKQPLFFDRFHIGELTYGSIFRKETIDENTIKRMEEIDKQLCKLEAKTIYVYAEPEIIKERIGTRGDWYIQPGNVEMLLKTYNEQLSKTSTPILKVDNSGPITEEKIKKILFFIYGI